MPFVSTDRDYRTLLKIVVQPKARRSQLLGLHDNMVKLGVNAPPVDGKANLEVIDCLADCLGLKKKDISIVSGRHSRRKVCHIEQLSEEEVRGRMNSLLHF